MQTYNATVAVLAQHWRGNWQTVRHGIPAIKAADPVDAGGRAMSRVLADTPDALVYGVRVHNAADPADHVDLYPDA